VSGVVTFLSDYGLTDEFVGVCHGVMRRRCPTLEIIDITHGVPRGDVRAGALMLRAALPYMPDAVHLAVVDPGVGGPRRALALRVREGAHVLVGPDNGLLIAAADALGGVVEAHDIGRSAERSPQVSPTFHGRDVFAPVAAALACGTPLNEVGEPVAPDSLTPLELPTARTDGDVLTAHVLAIDSYGNVSLDAEPAELTGAVLVTLAGREHRGTAALTFSDVGDGELLVYEDSRGALALAVNRGSAAALLGVFPGDQLTVRRC
jgi:S-adenosylmethionine hydrolase